MRQAYQASVETNKILTYRVSDKYDPTETATLLEEAASCLPPNTEPSAPTPNIAVYCDSGVENINEAVDKALTRFQLQRVIAQIDVQFSNSLIEAFWRSSKYNSTRPYSTMRKLCNMHFSFGQRADFR